MNNVIGGLSFSAWNGKCVRDTMRTSIRSMAAQNVGVYMQRKICYLDDTTTIRIRPKLSDTKILASAEESTRDDMGRSYSASNTRVLQLARNIEAPMGFGRGSYYSQLIVWLVVIGQLLYIFVTKSDGAWSGFSWLVFADLWPFVRLSFASAVMLCLEFWYLMIVVVITGRLQNPLIPVDAISICMNIQGWDAMIAIGFNAAISVRVSNELGASKPKAAKFAVVVVSMTSISIGLVCSAIVFATRGYFPYLFTSSKAVAKETTHLAILLGFTVLLNSLQPVLSGVAVGAGWQALVAYINIACYYVVGLPAGILLGFTFDLGVMGIWGGMIGGIVLQTILIVIISTRNWNKEASEAETRVKRWGGAIANQQ